jgi:hypothetical protein
MKALPVSFTSDGFAFCQLDRSSGVALFHKRKGDLDGSYEVVLVQRVPERVLFGRLVEAHEAMPPSEAWGEKGWTYRDKAGGLSKMQDLITRKNTPHCRCSRPKPTPIPAESRKPCTNELDGTLVP